MPFPNEHACRMADPSKFKKMRRMEGIGEVDGKRLDAIIGVREDGKSEVQSFRYPLSEGWSEDAADAHCKGHHGMAFEPAMGDTGDHEKPEEGHEELAIADAEKRVREREVLDLLSLIKGAVPSVTLYKPTGYLKAVEAPANAADGAVQEKDMVFVASEESVDRFGDVVDAAGWDLEEFKKNPVLMYSHHYLLPPVGIVPRIWVEGKQLLNTVRFDDEDEFARLLHGKYSRGVMRAESVGFQVLEVEELRANAGETHNGRFHFKLQELLEISLVAVPAHPHALQRLGLDSRFMLTVPSLPWPTENGFDALVRRVAKALANPPDGALPPVDDMKTLAPRDAGIIAARLQALRGEE